MAIEEVEAEAAREPSAKLATPAPANQNGKARRSLTTLWSILRRAGDGAQSHSEALSGHSEDGTDWGERRDTWLTELLARASRGVDNDEQDFTPRWAPTQSGGGN